MAYGVEDHTRLPAIHALLEFGDVIEVRKGTGNYIFARFADQFSVQTALYRRVILLNDKAVIGVCPPPPGCNLDLGAANVDDLGLPRSAFTDGRPPRVFQGLLKRAGEALASALRRLV